MEGAAAMTNEQMWTMWATFLTILELAETKEQAIAKVKQIIETTAPKKT